MYKCYHFRIYADDEDTGAIDTKISNIYVVHIRYIDSLLLPRGNIYTLCVWNLYLLFLRFLLYFI